MLTEKEINAIRFYQGDVRKRIGGTCFSKSERESGFFGIPKAYKTMNCLMFEGIDNEKERIAEDMSSLNPQIFREIEKVVDVYYDVFRAMCKCAKAGENDKKLQTLYRTDRGISVEEMKKQGKTISFTSTSKDSCPKEYFRKKKKLTLLEIVMPSDIPCLDFEKIFGSEYYFADQKEILLPPFLCAHFYEGKLTEEEKEYRDAEGMPPQGKYTVVLANIIMPKQKKTMQECGAELQELARNKEKMANILEKLTKQDELTEQETKEYCDWKNKFRKIIIEGFETIQNECIKGEESFLNRRICLREDVEKKIKEFDYCRKKYKSYMRICNIMLAITSVAPLVCMALSFIQGFEVGMKIVAILTSAGGLLLTRILKVEAYHLKLYQRTKTCLNLRDLFRQIIYEYCWSEEKLGEYVERFRTIIKEDTSMSLQNLQLQMDYEGELFQDKIILF